MDMRVDSLPRLQADNGQSGQNRILNDYWAHVLGKFNSVFEPFSTEGFRTNATQIPRGTQVLQLLICKLRVFSPLRPLPGGRRSAAAPAGASDGRRFRAKHNPKPSLALTALSLAPCHPPSDSVLPRSSGPAVFVGCRRK